MTLWCHNAKTGEIFSYKQENELTDFPRGTFLAYGVYLTTDFRSKEEAQESTTPHLNSGVCLYLQGFGGD